MLRNAIVVALATLVAGVTPSAVAGSRPMDPYPSTYRALASTPVLIQHATILTGRRCGRRIPALLRRWLAA